MKRKTNRTAYGMGQPLIDVFSSPIAAKRAPTDNDLYDIGQLWIDMSPDQNLVWILTSYNDGTTAGVPVWRRVDSSASNSLTWQRTDANVFNLAANSGYVLHTAGNKIVTLPAVAALGSVIRIIAEGLGNNTVSITQRAGQYVKQGASTPTVGAGHGLRLGVTNYASQVIELICTEANTQFVVTNVHPALPLLVF